MTLRFTPEALEDIEEIHARVAQNQTPARAYKVTSLIRVAINRLSAFPSIGRLGRLAGTRELVIPRLPYVIVYLVRGDEVVSRRVIHQTRQWPPAADSEGR